LRVGRLEAALLPLGNTRNRLLPFLPSHSWRLAHEAGTQVSRRHCVAVPAYRLTTIDRHATGCWFVRIEQARLEAIANLGPIKPSAVRDISKEKRTEVQREWRGEVVVCRHSHILENVRIQSRFRPHALTPC
jgi:hypothetical protein